MLADEILLIRDYIFPMFSIFYNQYFPAKRRGRKSVPPEKILATVIRVLKTGCQWRSVEESEHYANGSTAHHNFQKWVDAGLFDKLFSSTTLLFNIHVGYQLTWQSIDCTKVQAPVRRLASGRENTGPNPTDRGFKGSKLSLLVDKRGYILGYCSSGANVHDSKLLEETIKNGMTNIVPFIGNKRVKMNLCLDKGYDGEASEAIAFSYGYFSHIRSRGEEKYEKDHDKTGRKKSKRYVVERTNAWMKGYRAIRTRHTYYADNFDGLVELAIVCSLMKPIVKKVSKEIFEATALQENWDEVFKLQEEYRATLGSEVLDLVV